MSDGERVAPTRPVAVVTGASGGIGRAIAWRLHEAGYAVLAQYRSRSEEVDQLTLRIKHAGGNCWPVQADLAEPAGVQRTAAAARDVIGSGADLALTGVVNNAGKVLGPPFGDVTSGAFDNYFALNVRAPLLLTQELVGMLGRGGAVVNVSSVAAHFSSPGDIVYAMSKAALESFTRNSAEALALRGVRINTVIPGFTDNGHALFRDPSVRARLSEVAVLGGVSQPESVAAAITFLLSAEADRITGATLDVSGGSALGARPKRDQHASLRSLAEARVHSS